MLRWLLLLPLLLVACSPVLPDQKSIDQLKATAPTHTRLSDLPYERLSVPATVTFRLEPGGPVMQLGDFGKQYVKGFELPADGGDLRLVLRSYDMPFSYTKRNILYPIVVMLDAEHKPIGVSSLRALRFTEISLINEPSEQPRLELAFEIGGEPRARVRYLLIHTSRNMLEFGHAALDLEPYRVAAAAYVPIFIPSGGGGGPSLPIASPVGSLKLMVMPARR